MGGARQARWGPKPPAVDGIGHFGEKMAFWANRPAIGPDGATGRLRRLDAREPDAARPRFYGSANENVNGSLSTGHWSFSTTR